MSIRNLFFTPEAVVSDAALFDGRFLVRLNLRRAQRTADAATVAAIDKALADPNFVDDTTASLMDQVNGAQAGPGGILQTFIQFLIANLPQILALILALFGG